jgi:glycosyltransferase involved in cell wall biosynthesis
MTVRSSGKGIIFVDRSLSTADAYPAITWQLASRMPAERWSALTTSPKHGRVPFLMDMLATLWRQRHSYAAASIAVFSGGPAFAWAEVAAQMLRSLGKPYVAQLHGGNLPDFARRWPVRVTRLLSSAAVVTAPSRYLQESMRQYRSDIRLLPNAIDLSSYPYRVRSNPAPRLVWLRAFHAIYNPGLSLRVLVALLQEHPTSTLTMIGPDKHDGSLQAFRSTAEELRLEGHIEYAGLVKKADVPTWLDRGDIFINTTNFDNTPISVIEAMACGLCVVSTNVGGIPDLLEDGRDALLVPPNDPTAMTEALRRILGEPELAENLSHNARKKAECLDWAAVLPQWEALFAEIVNHV